MKHLREKNKRRTKKSTESLDKVIRSLKSITKNLCEIWKFKMKIYQKELEEREIILGKDDDENNHNNIQISKV